MNKPLITAIIPTYQRPHFLKRAVKSVLAQSYPHFTLLIADDASGKETDLVTEAFMQKDKRVKLLKHDTNIGAIRNFHTALMQVSTPYVCMLADDDFVAPFFFEEALPYFSRYPEIAFCGGGGLILDQQYRVKTIEFFQQKVPPSGYYLPPEGLFVYLRSTFGIAFSSLLFKTSIVHEIGGFDLKIRNGADEYLISQCAARYPIYLLTERPFYCACHHEGSLSGKIDYPLFEHEAARLYEHMDKLTFSAEQKEEIDHFFQKRQLKILSNAYRHFYLQKDFRTARAYADKLYARTHAFYWKRKGLHATLCNHFPFFASLYDGFRKCEKRVRSFKAKKAAVKPCAQEAPDAHRWREYALSLEKD